MYDQITSNKIKSVLLIAFFVVLVVVVGVVFSYMFDLGFVGPVVAFALVVVDDVDLVLVLGPDRARR